MHSLSLTDYPSEAVTSMSTLAAPSVSVDVTTTAEITPTPCDGVICETGEATGSVACVLALLTLLLLLLPPRSGWADVLSRIRYLCTSALDLDSASPRSRPSLVVLSISRT